MPPTDEEYLDTARAALTALIAELDTARQRGDRGECRRRADDIRALVRRFTEILSEEDQAPLFRLSEQAMARTIRDLGVSAWEEPETIAEARARMGKLPAAPAPGALDRVNEHEPSPLTDEELDLINVYAENAPAAGRDLIHRLVAEARRLRSRGHPTEPPEGQA
jgi:hypothetical protein